MSSEQKFRPYFTSSELLEIISALKSAPTPRRMTLVRYLESFLLKINHGIISPSHITAPSLESRLGMDDSPVPISPALTGEAAYQKWLSNPVKATPHEISAALEWRYLNDMMSPEEESEYERAQMAQITSQSQSQQKGN